MPSTAHNSLRRMLGAGAVLGFFVTAAVLLWTDRAGHAFGDFLDVVARTGRRIETRYDIDVVDRSDIPGESDQVIHALFWGTGMLIIGFVLRRRLPVALTALFLGATSLFFELAQPVLSASRGVEPSDAVANLVGIAAAALLLGGALIMMRRMAGDDRTFHGDQLHYAGESTDEYFLP